LTKSDNSYAVYSRYNSIITIGGGSRLETEGNNAYAVFADYGGTVNLIGDQTIKVNLEKTIYALATDTDSTNLLPRIMANGRLDITGGIYVGRGGEITLGFKNGSALFGSTTVSDGTGALNLSMEGTKWDMLADSSLTNLDITGAGTTVDFRNESQGIGKELYIDNLKQSGGSGATFVMRTDIAAGLGDRLTVGKTAAGAHMITVYDQGDAATTGEETLRLVTAPGGASFELTGGTTEIGPWEYALRPAFFSDAEGWELYSDEQPGAGGGTDEPEPEPEPEQPGGTGATGWEIHGTGQSGVSASASVNTFTGAYLMSYAETQTMMQRLGDLRAKPALSGFWFRAYGGKFESNSRSFVRNFDMDYGGVQIGYDRKIINNRNGELYTGALFGYSKGDLDYGATGSGTVDSKTAGVYGTYLRPDGFYADLLLKYMWMKNDFDTLNSSIQEVVSGGGLSTGGFGVSLELGKHFNLAGAAKSGWYIEPQAQISYTHQDGGSFAASNGLKIGIDGYTSVLGRVGFLLGYETEKTNFYAKVSREKEFDGDVTVVANGLPIGESFGGDWWTYGIGCTSKLNGRSSVYLSVERSSGGAFTEPWKIFAGCRIDIL